MIHIRYTISKGLLIIDTQPQMGCTYPIALLTSLELALLSVLSSSASLPASSALLPSSRCRAPLHGTASNARPCCMAIDSPTCAPHSGRGPFLVLTFSLVTSAANVHVSSARSAQRKSNHLIRSRRSHKVSNSIKSHERYHRHKHEHRRVFKLLLQLAAIAPQRAHAGTRPGVSPSEAQRGS